MIKAKLLIAALVPFLVASCYDRKPEAHTTQIASGVSRIHDSELGVTCWTVDHKGITCLRDVDNTREYPQSSTQPVDGGWPEDGPARHAVGGPGV